MCQRHTSWQQPKMTHIELGTKRIAIIWPKCWRCLNIEIGLKSVDKGTDTVACRDAQKHELCSVSGHLQVVNMLQLQLVRELL